MIGPLFSYFHIGNPNHTAPAGRTRRGQLQAEPEGWYHAALNSNIELGLWSWGRFYGLSVGKKAPSMYLAPARVPSKRFRGWVVCEF